MCLEILMPDGETLVTMRDAADTLPVMITDQPVYNGDLDICLCSLDIDQTAKANGYGVVWPEHRMWAGFARTPARERSQ